MTLTDDPVILQKRVAYVQSIRDMHKGLRLTAYVGCLIGVVVMVLGAFMTGAPPWLRWAGLAVIIPSWLVFIYVMVSRASYVRAHPFDPGEAV
jgi:hypothetical protein